MALAAIAWPHVAMAQDSQTAPSSSEQPATEIVVSAIRATIQDSIETKRETTAIVDSLSADDIGDIPALSVGQAIQTITGATTHREKGDASEIALRGLGPFLSNSTFNGREASNGSGDRSVNFNQFPSELINKITIYKSQQANLIEGGVAGTIELGTVRPLDYKRRRIQMEGKVNYNPYQDRVYGDTGLGWRGTISLIDQFSLGGLGDIGVSIGYQRQRTANPEETLAGSSTWSACDDSVDVLTGNCRNVTNAQVNDGTPFYIVPNAMTYRQISENDQRDAVFGAIQWRPSPTVEINLDVEYSDRSFAENRSDLTFSEMRLGLKNREVDPAGFLRYVEGMTSLESNSTLTERSEEYLGGGLEIAVEASDRLRLVADVSYSDTTRLDRSRSTRLRTDPLDIYGNRTPVGNQRVAYTYDARDSFAPVFTIDPRFDLNDWSLFSDDARLRRDERERSNTIWAGRLDASYELSGLISALHAGVRYSHQTYNDYTDRVEMTQGDRNVDRDANLACRTRFPQRDYLKDAPGDQISSWATFDPLCLFDAYLGTEDPGPNDDLRAITNTDVLEQVWAGYVMADYEGDIGSLPVRGNVGVRVVRTEVESNGLRSALDIVNNGDGTIRLVETGDFETVTIKHDTTRVLPSANMIFELKPELLLRAAAYRAMSRPAPSALSAGRSIQLDDGTAFTDVADAIRNIQAAGSPRLEPLMSWNGDLALEWYPNRDTILSTTVYYKRFSGGFQPVRINEDFVLGGQQVNIPVSQTRNSDDKSTVYGLELTAATRFSFLPAPLDGLGAKVSYNYAKSNFKSHDILLGDIYDPVTEEVEPGIIPPANLSGYSKHVLSAQAYYDIGPVSLQGIYNYRSQYYQDFVGGNSQLRYVGDNQTFDLRASLDVMPGVSLRVEALNIFNEPKVTYMPVVGSTRQYHYYGSKYFIGLRVKL
ncbi:TonB-dependent receptor [Aurantiacibacter xanthus]|nr:TonB-dependent receptor [Aurantiacibacter xanthus]